ncbi:ABC transporter ATP-binding protein [Desulfoprunum sp.]|uniref:ABC transporter ATP-binding protein n=1 Tax=Desulfoprunum sp. TaxID=2020866 RepID=UPI003C753BB9
MSSDAVIKVENLCKCYQIYEKPRDRLYQMLMRGHRQYYREFWALRDVSFEIQKGETVGIIGRNGSGKSTLLQMVCGTLNPTSGSIRTSGRIAALLELGSGFNPEFTGRENVYTNGAVLGLSENEIDSCFDDIAEFADIGEFIERPVKTYSSGMMVRLAFAVQATIEPDILIVDEALAVGDEKFQRKCFARLEALKNNGTSILFVSHSGPQIVELCDRAILLEQGRRLMCAKPMQVVRAYQKLIYAPREEQIRLAQEYQAMDQRQVAGEESGAKISAKKDSVPDSPSAVLAQDHFDPGLVPETTTVYPIQGAEIQAIEILDTEGRAVNVLQLGGEYQFVVTGRFLADIQRVYFGIHIRSISGAVITGQRYPEIGKYIEHIDKSNNFRIKFHFRMIVLPGVYFVGGGIWSAGEKEQTCCHRILDALMFRLKPEPKIHSFGYVDASSRESEVEIF